MDEQARLDEYRQQVENRIHEEEQDLPSSSGNDRGNSSEGSNSEELDLRFIRKCYDANEVGDSILYNTLFMGKHVYDVINKKWLTYVGPHWQDDHDGKALADIEGVVNQYMRLLKELNDDIEKLEGSEDKDDKATLKSLFRKRKEILGRFDKLRSATGRIAVLKCAISNSDPLTIHPDSMDQQPWLLPVKNGVIDLRTGECRPGRPGDYFTTCANVEWKGLDEPAPIWDNFLLTSLGGNDEVVEFLIRSLGAGLVGMVRDRFFIVLYGPHGQNGKGKLMEIIFHIMDSLCSPIQTELLLSQRFTKSADGPSPAVIDLKGKRIVWASETEEGQSFANGLIKKLTGGDPLTGRGVGARDQVKFLPTHTLLILCNTLLRSSAADSAFWERIKVVEFPYSFVQRTPQKDKDGNEIPIVLEKYQKIADPDLFEKLKVESSGILASLVRGCMSWQLQGLNPPQKILDDSQKYRRHEDDIQDFIDTCCELAPEEKTLFKHLYARFKIYWEEVSSTKPMAMKKFGSLLSLKFEKSKSSVTVYHGIKLRVDIENTGEN